MFNLIRTIVFMLIPFSVFVIIVARSKKNSSEEEEYLESILKKRNEEEKGFLLKRNDSINLFLSQYGAEYNLGINRAWQFVALKSFCSIGVILISSQVISIPFALICGVLGYMFPTILVKLMNNSDNESMVTDLKAIYDTLRIQQSAGIFISNSLTDCYLVIKNKRLKKAMKEVSGEILAERDIAKAINSLSVKFRNDYIDEFVTIVTQSVQTGQLTKILEEISKQMIGIEEIINVRRENAIDRKLTTIIILIFIGIFAAALYGLGVRGLGSVSNL